MSVDHATEMVVTAHRRQLAMRYEVSALEAAIEAGHTTTVGQQAYALSWLAEYAAGRVLELSPGAPAEIPPPKWQDAPAESQPHAVVRDDLAYRCERCGRTFGSANEAYNTACHGAAQAEDAT